ncbi:MAG: pilus assembly protein PilM [Oscillospiraceae bacterium]|nr:pilus assembly protein PilM [Oscillospiraceae bacterium]
MSVIKGTKENKRLPRARQSEDDIFALDIGTRNVVGIIGHMEDGVFCVDYNISEPHKRRAMLDGQIEDIGETARVVKRVKEQLEEKSGMTLCRVAIAAAGRALVTKRSSIEKNIEGKENISEEVLRSLELEAVAVAQDELDKENRESGMNFYCVGHTVIRYTLDDYPIKSLLGHKGNSATVELIAAFLPGLVVESLYTVMDMCGLEVCSLTLEPIAAMNVIIPPEVRLINIALVDIGAGTTDIAISQNGSIVAYAMATVAGDEITEDIIQKYLVDFETAEEMKVTPLGEDVVFTDILGFEHTVESNEFYSSLYPAVDELAETIAKNILEANGAAPAAVFLVGGGSLIPDLTTLVSDKLQIPENRVAVGGQTYQKNVVRGTEETAGPEYVTPIGIGITATLQTGYDFSTVTLNGNKVRLFDSKAVTVADLLMNAGYKTTQIIGKSGRGLTFTLNGEKQSVRGETSTPASIDVDGKSVPLEYTVKKGDVIQFTPATVGQNASVCISDIVGEIAVHKVSVDGVEYTFGTTARVGGEVVSGSYSIQNYDNIVIDTVETLEELIFTLPFPCENLNFYKGERLIKGDYILSANDAFTTREKSGKSKDNAPNRARDYVRKNEKAHRTVDLLSNMPLREGDAVPAGAAEINMRDSYDAARSGAPMSGKAAELAAQVNTIQHNQMQLQPAMQSAQPVSSAPVQTSLFGEPQPPAGTVYAAARSNTALPSMSLSAAEAVEMASINEAASMNEAAAPVMTAPPVNRQPSPAAAAAATAAASALSSVAMSANSMRSAGSMAMQPAMPSMSAMSAMSTAPTISVQPARSAPEEEHMPVFNPENLTAPELPPVSGVISVFLNSKRITLDATKDGSPHEFLELMALADIDLSNPPESGKMILTLNGRDASFMDLLHSGDRIVIKWADK